MMYRHPPDHTNLGVHPLTLMTDLLKHSLTRHRHPFARPLTVLVLTAIVYLMPLQGLARIEPPINKGPALPEQRPIEGLRSVFLDAEAAVKAEDAGKTKALFEQLEHYPLLPYLEYLEISQKISKRKPKEIEQFLKKYPKNRLSEKLRSQWLYSLAKQKQWTMFLKFYEPSTSTALQCHYRNALLANKKTKAAFDDIETLWLVGRSQPEACDPVFKAWIDSRGFKNQYYWQRIELALQHNQFSLARYLAQQSGNERDIERVKRWISVYQSPNRIAKTTYSINNSHDQALVLMALKRLLRQNLVTFEQQWARYEANLHQSKAQRQAFLGYVARWYSWHYYPKSPYWLNLADPDLKDYELMQRRIRLAIYQRNWPLVRDWIYALPLDQRQEQAWRYWLIRARFEILKEKAQNTLTGRRQQLGPLALSETTPHPLSFHHQFMRHLKDERLGLRQLHLNQNNSQILAELKQALQSLAENRSFYGFMASEILGQPLSLNHQSTHLSQTNYTRILELPGIQEAQEWYALKRWTDAQSAWLYTTDSLSASDKRIAAKIAHDWGWFHQGIYTAAFSDHKDDLVVRFPLGFFDVVYEQTLSQKIYADWTFALIRQESAYRPSARSPVGALGLMQLMPSTAKLVSKKSHERYPGNLALLEPEINVKTGTRYLAQLYEQFNGNLLLATAAYNAGPSRSKSWQHESEAVPGDIWIDTIPIQETRDYVKNIMTYQAIYRWHLGNAPRLSASLERVPPLSETTLKSGILAASSQAEKKSKP